MPNPTNTNTARRVSQLALLLHLRKTGMLVAAVMRDVRVHPVRKILFGGILLILLGGLLAPEFFMGAVTLLIPVLGWLGIPLEVGGDVGLDWIVFAFAAFNLLKLFPREIVGEHYDRLFRARH